MCSIESIANSAFLSALNLSQISVSQLVNDESVLNKIVSNCHKIIIAYKDFLDCFHFLKLLLTKHDKVWESSCKDNEMNASDNFGIKILLIFLGLGEQLKFGKVIKLVDTLKDHNNELKFKCSSITKGFFKVFHTTCIQIKQNDVVDARNEQLLHQIIRQADQIGFKIDKGHFAKAPDKTQLVDDNCTENMNVLEDISSSDENDEDFNDDKFDQDRILFNEFYWEKKKLFQPTLAHTQSSQVVEIVSRLVDIYTKSKSLTVFHEDEEYFDEILQDCGDGIKWTNTARKGVLWTLARILDEKSILKFSSQNAAQLKKIVDNFDISTADTELDAMELFAVRRHLRRHLNADCLTPLDTLIVQRLQYKSLPKDFLLAEPPGLNDFYFLSPTSNNSSNKIAILKK